MKHDIQIEDYDAQEIAGLASGQVVDWGNIFLKAAQFYEHSRGQGAIVGIIDTAGQFTDHDDLRDNCRPQYDNNVTNDPDFDKHGHGTHCAGIVAAVDNDKGVIGIAPDAALVALKALGDSGGGSFNWIAAQIRYFADLELDEADKGRKKILSLSLGTSPGFKTPAVVDSAIRYAIGKGVFFVVAAGNSGYTGDKSTVGAPGNHPLVLTVASSQKPGDQRSGFSSGGIEVDVIAPGSGIYSTHKNNSYAYLSGTSMATPKVAGIVALLVSYYENLVDQAQLMTFMTAHATDILAEGRDNESGFGAPVIINYLDKNPGDAPDPPNDDEPGNDDPPSDDPAKPNPPRREKVVAMIPLGDDALFTMQWRRENMSMSQLATVSHIVVEVDSDVQTHALSNIVREYVRGFFAGRMLVLKNTHDLREAALYTGLFLQFIADDDWVDERFGVRLDLKVLSLRMTDNRDNKVLTDQTQIVNRATSMMKAVMNGEVYTVGENQ